MVASLAIICIDMWLLSAPTVNGWLKVMETHGIYVKKDIFAYKKLNEEISKSDFSIKNLNFYIINSNFSSSSLKLSKAVYDIKMNPLINKDVKKEAISMYNKNYSNGFNIQKNTFILPKCSLAISCNLFSHYYSQAKNELDKDTLLQLEINKKIINDEVKNSFNNELNTKLIERNISLFRNY